MFNYNSKLIFIVFYSCRIQTTQCITVGWPIYHIIRHIKPECSLLQFGLPLLNKTLKIEVALVSFMQVKYLIIKNGLLQIIIIFSTTN